ncbi:hypothetical protein CKN80_02710 [Carnobacterium divergens]|nr:hypothetical protein CKN81_02910 [Carnobacterium divergens]TFJ53633.1 hypothetical protein CKN80_02710 [Carnobacterium divergens]
MKELTKNWSFKVKGIHLYFQLQIPIKNHLMESQVAKKELFITLWRSCYEESMFKRVKKFDKYKK